MKNKIILFLVALLFTSTMSLAQQNCLLYKDYVQQVISNHPSIQAAKSNIKIASAAVLESQGAFDPFFNYESEQKKLNNQLYYNYQLHYYNHFDYLKIGYQNPLKYYTRFDILCMHYLNL